jgi:hypothetical protein
MKALPENRKISRFGGLPSEKIYAIVYMLSDSECDERVGSGPLFHL